MKTHPIALLAACAVVLTGCADAASPLADDTGGGMVVDTSAPLEPQAKAAILADDLEVFEAALAAGLELSADPGGGYTPLHIAANAGADEIVAMLEAAGAA
jgi:hypothetical protein